MTVETKKNLKNSTKIILFIGIGLLVFGGFFGLKYYKAFFAPNVSAEKSYLYIRTSATFTDLMDSLMLNTSLNDLKSFEQAARKMKLEASIKPGRYLLKAGMSNRTIVNMIKSGNQDPVKLKFQNIRKKDAFAAYLAKNMEADSLAFIKVLDSTALLEKYGFNNENSYTMFIPNTYEMYWNTKPADFFEKMHNEYEKFWNASRRKKAEALKLTPVTATILASIVDAEALYDKEMPIIAGLYLNRLNRGILLQADPTVIFANNDFTVKRVTGKLLGVDSKYNTYKYSGLPPGPIMMPSINAIDAVLNRQENQYIYMCAKEDFSGYHNFAETKEQHEINAKKYREALNKRNIYR